jgi:CHASE2 domain-containing sensor protein/signal transduction histidine kinase
LSAPTREERRLRREWLLTVVMASALLGWLVFSQSARLWGDVLYDRMMSWQGFHHTDDIVIIAVDDRSLQQLGGWPLQRSRYTELLERFEDPRHRPKAVGFDLLLLDPSPYDDSLAQAMRRTPTVLPIEFTSDLASGGTGTALPAGPLAEAGRLSHINVSFDADGVIRGFRTLDSNHLHFALAMHSLGERDHRNILQAQVSPSYQRFRMVDPSIGFPMVSLADALSEEFPLSLVKDKYVMLGVTAPSLGDRYPTLYSGEHGGTPGVAILASVLNASLNNAFIASVEDESVFALNWVAMSLLLMSLIFFKPRTTVVISVVLIALAVLGSYALLNWEHVWLNPTPLIVVAALIQPFWAWRRLEAMTGVIFRRANELRQFQPEERSQGTQATSSREVVLQYAKLLDHAVDSARNELQFLSAVVDEMPDAVVIFDPQDKLLLSNNKMQALIGDAGLEHGSALSELAERWHLPLSFFTDLANPTPGDALPVRPSQDPQASQRNVFQIHTPQGLRDIYLKNASLDAPLGGQLHLLIFMDITELRQYQTQRDRALQFLSHDMRTPLASILSLTRPGAATVDGEMPRDKVEHHARALLGMMDDFILTVNAEAPRYELRAELLDNLLNDAIELSNDLARAKGITIVDACGEEPVFLNANARLLVRAFLNLLFNAIKFSPANSQIRVACEPITEDHKSMLRVTISNPVDRLEAEQEIAGFGLGLHFVDTVIARHQGSIHRHLPSEGDAEVSIKLPILSE